MRNEDLTKIIQQYGTPTYVFDTGALKDRVRAVRELWGDQVKLCYSVKANPFLIPAMLDVVSHLEVCSPGELEICEHLHVPMGSIVYSGVNKEPDDIYQAVSDGVGICTAESIRQVELLNREGERERCVNSHSRNGGKDSIRGTRSSVFSEVDGEPSQKDKIPVLLRLNSGSQFGMSKEDLLYVIHNRSEWPYISIEGIHYFVGTQRKNKGLHQQKEELEMLRGLFEEVEAKEHFKLKKLEYGPGLPVPLFVNDDFSDTLAPAREIADSLKSVTEWADLTVEAGRFFTTECGYYLTKVVDLKTVRQPEKNETAGSADHQSGGHENRTDGKHYCIVDGGINHVNYLGQIMGMKQPVIRHFRSSGTIEADPESSRYEYVNESKDSKSERVFETGDKGGLLSEERELNAKYEYAICGSLCTTNDDLVRSCEMSEIHLGDVLVFENIGAYSVTEGIYLFLSREMPRIVLYNDNSDVRMVRDFVSTSTLNTIGI